MDLAHECDHTAAGDRLHPVDERIAEGKLELLPGRADRLPLAVVDQRPLERRVDVLEEHDEVVTAHDGARGGGPAAVVLTVELRDRVRDLEPLLGDGGHAVPSPSAPSAWHPRGGGAER